MQRSSYCRDRAAKRPRPVMSCREAYAVLEFLSRRGRNATSVGQHRLAPRQCQRQHMTGLVGTAQRMERGSGNDGDFTLILLLLLAIGLRVRHQMPLRTNH